MDTALLAGRDVVLCLSAGLLLAWLLSKLIPNDLPEDTRE